MAFIVAIEPCLSHLPTEMLENIVTFCVRADVNNLRLLCQRVGTIADPPLFSRLVLIPHEESSARLEKLAKHRLARHVRCFVDDPRMIIVHESDLNRHTAERHKAELDGLKPTLG